MPAVKITMVFGRKKKEQITGTFKEASEIESCPIGKKVMLLFGERENYTGVFKGIDGDSTIMLQSMLSLNTIGLPLDRLSSFFQES